MNLKVLKIAYHQTIFGVHLLNLKSQNYELFHWSLLSFIDLSHWHHFYEKCNRNSIGFSHPTILTADHSWQLLLDSCQPSVRANQPRKTRSLHWYTLCIIAITSWRIVKLNTWFTFPMDQMLEFALKQNRHINMLFTLQSADFKSPG